jgi:hypothetical protein
MEPRRRDPFDRQKRSEARLIEENVAQRPLCKLVGDEEVDGEGAVGGDEGIEGHTVIEAGAEKPV